MKFPKVLHTSRFLVFFVTIIHFPFINLASKKAKAGSVRWGFHRNFNFIELFLSFRHLTLIFYFLLYIAMALLMDLCVSSKIIKTIIFYYLFSIAMALLMDLCVSPKIIRWVPSDCWQLCASIASFIFGVPQVYILGLLLFTVYNVIFFSKIKYCNYVCTLKTHCYTVLV